MSDNTNKGELFMKIERLTAERDAVLAQNVELVAQVEALAKDRDEWKEAAAKVISVMQLSGIKVNNDYFTKCLRQIQADAIQSLIPKCKYSQQHKVNIITESMIRYHAERVKAGDV